MRTAAFLQILAFSVPVYRKAVSTSWPNRERNRCRPAVFLDGGTASLCVPAGQQPTRDRRSKILVSETFSSMKNTYL